MKNFYFILFLKIPILFLSFPKNSIYLLFLYFASDYLQYISYRIILSFVFSFFFRKYREATIEIHTREFNLSHG